MTAALPDYANTPSLCSDLPVGTASASGLLWFGLPVAIGKPQSLSEFMKNEGIDFPEGK